MGAICGKPVEETLKACAGSVGCEIFFLVVRTNRLVRSLLVQLRIALRLRRVTGSLQSPFTPATTDQNGTRQH
jgi:hypothetical protein